MKWSHSIRWQLQLWHALLLVFVLAGFGLTAWQLQRMNLLSRVDRELEQRLGAVASMMHPREDPRPGRRRPDDFAREDRPPSDDLSHSPAELRLSAHELSLFEGVPGPAFYYIVWRWDGRQAVHSTYAPPDTVRPEPLRGPPDFRSRSSFRECYHDTPAGECILVGRDTREELAEIRRFAWLLAGVGGAVLGVGLAGAGWITARARLPEKTPEAGRSRPAHSHRRRRQRVGTARAGSQQHFCASGHELCAPGAIHRRCLP